MHIYQQLGRLAHHLKDEETVLFGIIEITPVDNSFESVLNVRQYVANEHVDRANEISRYAVAEDFDIPLGRQERLI